MMSGILLLSEITSKYNVIKFEELLISNLLIDLISDVP